MKTKNYSFEEEIINGLSVAFNLKKIKRNCQKLKIDISNPIYPEINISQQKDFTVITEIPKKNWIIQYFIFGSIDILELMSISTNVMPELIKFLILNELKRLQ